jgi:two-component system, OmpR family, phosphate regulon response regulator OmpR
MMSARRSAKPEDEAPHVLVVDDDRRLRDLLARFLGEHGYRVTTAHHAADASSKLEHFVFDVLVLDVMMPGENGFDFARRLRVTSQIPILMLTAQTGSSDRITGLEIGADDYLSKPFEPRELILRLANILKRGAAANAAAFASTRPESVSFGPFTYWLNRGELRDADQTIRLTEREREIMTTLAARPGDPVSREDLAGQGEAANDRTIDVQINRLRRKIERDPADPLFLQTVRGTGYRLVVERS